MLIQQPAYLYFLGSLERIMALVLQIAFTMLVLYAVKQKKYIFLVYAILFHAFVDFSRHFTKQNNQYLCCRRNYPSLHNWGCRSYSQDESEINECAGKNTPPIGGVFLWIVAMVIAFSFLQLPLCFCIYNDIFMKLFYFILRKGSKK